MLFKVRWNKNSHVYTVYSVKNNIINWEPCFLVYEKQEHSWVWLPAEECEPVEE